jgi:hypothetical protein
MTRAGARIAAWVLLAWSLLSGCGPSFNGRLYEGHGVRFQVSEAPASWRRIDATGALLAYRDDAKDATIAVNGRCGRDAEDVPLQALTRHLFLQFTDQDVTEQRVVQMDGREALRTRMTARLDGVQKAFATYVLKKDGCVYDLLFISRPESFAAGVEAFDVFAAGFRGMTNKVQGD